MYCEYQSAVSPQHSIVFLTQCRIVFRLHFRFRETGVCSLGSLPHWRVILSVPTFSCLYSTLHRAAHVHSLGQLLGQRYQENVDRELRWHKGRQFDMSVLRHCLLLLCTQLNIANGRFPLAPCSSNFRQSVRDSLWHQKKCCKFYAKMLYYTLILLVIFCLYRVIKYYLNVRN